MLVLKLHILGVEVVHQSEIVVLPCRSVYIVDKDSNRMRCKNQLAPVEDRIRKISISVMLQIDDLETVLLSEEMTETAYTADPVDIRNRSHLMVVDIERIVGKGGNEVCSPVFPDRGSVDVSSAVNQDILTVQRDFGMHAVIVRVS